MDYLHQCVMCGWQRAAASPTVTSPRCENCGCALESVHASDSPAAERLAQTLVVPAAVRTAIVRATLVAGTAILMLAAARTGYSEGGFAMAVSAVGVAGLVLVNAVAAERR
jgi:predicted  nucleic acid-binding Zn-ribbon protein